MRSFFFMCFVCGCFLLISCDKENDDNIDCALVDVATEEFLIEVLDEEGNNLLLNETYKEEEIKVLVNGEKIGEAAVLKDSDPPLAYIFILEYGAENRIGDDYEVILNEEETDIMQIQYIIEDGICGFKKYIAQEVIYNGETMEIDDLQGNQKITVIK